MLSKNNFKERLKKMQPKSDRFSIRKLTIGVASILIGTVFWLGSTNTVHADENLTNQSENSVEENKVIIPPSSSNDQAKSFKITSSSEDDNSTTAIDKNKVQDVIVPKDAEESVAEQKNSQKTEQIEKQAQNNTSTQQPNSGLTKNGPGNDENPSNNDNKQIANKAAENENNKNNSSTADQNKTDQNSSLDKLKNNDQFANINKNITNSGLSNDQINQLDNELIKAKTADEITKILNTVNLSDAQKNAIKSIFSKQSINFAKEASSKLIQINDSTAKSIITDDVKYPSIINHNLAKLFPDLTPNIGKNYIFDQYELVYNNRKTNIIITLAVDRNNPTGSGFNVFYYITDKKYTRKINSGSIGSDQEYTSKTIPINWNYYDGSIKITNNAKTLSNMVQEVGMANFSLARIFGYGQISKDPYSDTSRAWGDSIPKRITQTVNYIDKNTGKPISGYDPIKITGLTGQHFTIEDADQIIKGDYLINPKAISGTLSDYEKGQTYYRVWIDDAGNLITEEHTMIDDNGTMHTVVYRSKANSDGSWGDPSKLGEKDIAANKDVTIDGYDIQNPYIPSTKDVNLIYNKLGKIIPVYPNGDPIPDIPNPQYNNDPDDPTQGASTKIPSVPGYHIDPKQDTHDGDIDINANVVIPPSDPSEGTKVIFIADDQHAEIHYIDQDNNNQDIVDFDKLTGKTATVITDDNIQNTIAALEKKGYKLVVDNFSGKGYKYDNDDSTTQKYDIVFKHDHITITPSKPGKPGTPINPDDPNGPKWPDGTDSKSLIRTGQQIIHYRYSDGSKAADDSTQSIEFDHSITYDKVTGKIISDNGWTPASQSYNKINSPSIKGYTPDKAVAGGETVRIDPKTGKGEIDKEYTVIYTKNPDQPTTPSNPTNPTSPTTPSAPNQPTSPAQPTNVPNHPITPQPIKPDVPQPHKDRNNVPKPQPKKPDKHNSNSNIVPHRQNSNYSGNVVPHEQHLSNGYVTKSNGQIINKEGQIVGRVDKVGAVHSSVLPQTGENQETNLISIMLGGVATAISLIGLAGRRKKE